MPASYALVHGRRNSLPFCTRPCSQADIRYKCSAKQLIITQRRMNMGSIGAGFSMSLDGFIAGPGDDIMRLFSWMFSGDTDVKVSIGEEEMDLKVASEDAERWEAPSLGAVLSGRRM